MRKSQRKRRIMFRILIPILMLALIIPGVASAVLAETSDAPQFEVRFDPQGGTGTMDSIFSNPNDEVTLPENGFTAAEGKSFKAWEIDGQEYSPGTKVVIVSDTVVMAVWEDITSTAASVAAVDEVPAPEAAVLETNVQTKTEPTLFATKDPDPIVTPFAIAATYQVDPDSMSLTLSVESTNNHTGPKRLWIYNNEIHVAIEYIQDSISMILNGTTNKEMYVHPDKDTIVVDGKELQLVGTHPHQHWVVFTFPSNAIDYSTETQNFTVNIQGGGHSLLTTFDIVVPKVNAVVTKTWTGGPMTPVSVDLQRRIPNVTEWEKVGDSVTLTQSGGTATYTWTDLPFVDNAGREYEYQMVESNPGEGYTVNIVNKSFNETTQTFTYQLENTYTPPTIEIPVTKVWDDVDNQDGKRPGSVTIKLLADGADTNKTLDLTAAEGWKDSFTNVPKTQTDGTPIEYTVEEVPLPVELGYETASISGNAQNGFVVTNSRTPETVTVEGSKTWDGGSERPPITIRLLKNGTRIDFKVVTEADGWSWSFENLPRYEAGKEITYTITEDAVADYSSDVSGYDVTNSYTPGLTSVQVTKAWADNDNQDGKRPENVTINLLTDGVAKGETLTLTSTNNWTGSFKDLTKNHQDGTLIEYTVEEFAVGNGYSTSITGNAQEGFVVTNSRTPETVEVEGSKTWNDVDNQDGKRPGSITIRLLKNGTAIDSKVVSETDGWKWSFTDLPKYEAGTEITYAIEEISIDGYSSEVSGYNVTNSYTPGKTSVQVTKAWADNDNQDGKRPDSVTVKLLADEVETGKILTLSQTNNWTGTFTELDEYKAGKKIVYTVEEDPVGNGYTAAITGDAQNGYVVTNSKTPETVAVEGSKTWDDNGNQDGKRPGSITIRLLKNGTQIFARVVSEVDGWSWSFKDLPKYEAGQEITYTITEDAIDGYSSVVSGYSVTNTDTPDQTSVQVTKVWADKNNQDGKRPASVTRLSCWPTERTRARL